MKAVSDNMSEQDMHAVAAYLEALTVSTAATRE